MEYEQLEHGNKVLQQSILTQDVGGFYKLVHPNAILVTHFPYPDTATGSETPALAALSPALAQVRADALGKRTPAQRKAQLLREQSAQREAQLHKYQAYLQARLDATSHPTAHQAGGSRGASKDGSSTRGTDGSPVPTENTSAKAVTATNAAAKGKKTSAASAPGDSALAAARAALRGTREHRGLVFYFNQPAPLPSMTTGGANDANGDVWGGSPAAPGASSAAAAGATNASNAKTGATTGKTGRGEAAEGSAAAAAGAATAAAPGSALEIAVSEAYGDFVDVTEGRLLICERFCLLLNWVNQDEYIADIEAQLDPRKGVLQDAEVLPPPPAPQSPQERFAQLGRMFTDRNQQVSRLTITWGREHLAFSDQLFFEDNQVICIHRRMLTLPEMLQRFPTNGQRWTQAQKVEKIRAELKDFYGVTKSRVAAVSHALPLLDFSFVPIGNDVTQLLARDTVPVTGRRHICRPERPVEDPRLAQGVFLNAENDPSKGVHTNRTLIKAKNKRGEEEAYEFTDNGHQRYQVFGNGAAGGSGGGAGGEEGLSIFDESLGLAPHPTSTRNRSENNSSVGHGNQSNEGGTMTATTAAGGGWRTHKFDATSLRISGCELAMPLADGATAATGAAVTTTGAASYRNGSHSKNDNNNKSRRPIRFLSIVRGLVANAVLTLHSLDLSDNHLSVLPELIQLPLQKLQLHGNDISDWAEVESKVCPLPYLTSVTLHGNPIADDDPEYRVRALARLVNSPHRRVPLRQLDFVMLTPQDLNQMGVRR